uniref:Chemokine (C-X-C motif) receptor 3, tandem duplicate 3 n=1 Tax=Mastacembelus armatus TaxID=205130 RepID=A0A7N8WL74_9TELE
MWKNMDVELDGFLKHNTTYDYDEDYQYEDESERKASAVALPVVLCTLVLVVGLLGNALLLVVLAKKRQSWRISDTFVLHLGVVDILLLLTLPFWAAQHARTSGWCVGIVLCKICGAVFNINFYCGIFLLVCISLDRCLFIVHNTQLYSQRKPVLVHLSCLLVWLVSLLLTIPDWVFLENLKAPEHEKTLCVHSYSQSGADWKLLSRVLHHTLGLLLPAATLIICCCCILSRLQRSSKGLQKHRAFMVLLMVFLLFWAPYNITLIVDTFKTSSKNAPDVSLQTPLSITSVLGYIHACIRPLLYFCLHENFRKMTLAILRCAPAESRGSLWDLGVGEEVRPEQSHDGEELKQISVKNHKSTALKNRQIRPTE